MLPSRIYDFIASCKPTLIRRSVNIITFNEAMQRPKLTSPSTFPQAYCIPVFLSNMVDPGVGHVGGVVPIEPFALFDIDQLGLCNPFLKQNFDFSCTRPNRL
jgi:hypothetical protein